MALILDSTPGACAGDLEVAYDAEANVDAVPYWVAKCACGWRSEPKYFRGYAMNDLRDHGDSGEGAGKAAASSHHPPGLAKAG